MELKRYQWVGLLAGFPLFSGAWLSAFYNTSWPGVIGLLLTVVALFIAVRVERRESRQQHFIYGATAGLLAGLATRLLGLVALWMAGGQKMVQFAANDDLFRVILAGDWTASLLLVAALAVLGGLIALIEPEAEDETEKTVVRTVKAKTSKARKK